MILCELFNAQQIQNKSLLIGFEIRCHIEISFVEQLLSPDNFSLLDLQFMFGMMLRLLIEKKTSKCSHWKLALAL